MFKLFPFLGFVRPEKNCFTAGCSIINVHDYEHGHGSEARILVAWGLVVQALKPELYGRWSQRRKSDAPTEEALLKRPISLPKRSL